MTDLGTLGGSTSVAFGVNPQGQVVGNSDPATFLWTKGVMTDLGGLGGNYGQAFAINAAGQVAGESETANGDTHATLWTRARTQP